MKNSQSRWALVVVAAAGLAGGLLGAGGKLLAHLGVSADGGTLALPDADGNPRATLSASADGLLLALNDADSKLRAYLGVVADGNPLFELRDASGHRRVVLGGTETQNVASGVSQKYPISTITLFGETGRVLWQAP